MKINNYKKYVYVPRLMAAVDVGVYPLNEKATSPPETLSLDTPNNINMWVFLEDVKIITKEENPEYWL